ncbi:hypothetical protein FACS1894190_07770 [Spirochaetia bacterium]|nr:hypothetical protein FACS1894190_07770 [Spirochaetia bacterium]
MNKNQRNRKKTVPAKICLGSLLAASAVLSVFFFINCSSTSAGAQTERLPPKHVYMGISSFSGSVKDITKGGALVPLNSQRNVDNFNKLFRTNYVRAEDFGNTLYYAVNRAIVNIYNGAETNKIPKDIDSVTIITITDGFDNSSASISHNAEIGKFPAGFGIDESARQAGEYPKFIKGLIDSLNIHGAPINAWALGFGAVAESELKQIASDGQAFKGDITGVIEKLDDIIRDVSKRNDKTQLKAAIGTYDSTTELRIVFDIDKSITGRVILEEGKYFFNIASESPAGILDRRRFADPNRIQGTPFNGNILYNFTFPLNGLFNANSGVLYRLKNGNALDREVIITLEPLSGSFKKNAVVYFVLDCSKSMTNMETLRTEIQRMIDRLYKTN